MDGRSETAQATRKVAVNVRNALLERMERNETTEKDFAEYFGRMKKEETELAEKAAETMFMLRIQGIFKEAATLTTRFYNKHAGMNLDSVLEKKAEEYFRTVKKELTHKEFDDKPDQLIKALQLLAMGEEDEKEIEEEIKRLDLS